MIDESGKLPREWLLSLAFYDSNGYQQTDDMILPGDFELFPGWTGDESHILVVEKSAYDNLAAQLAEAQAKVERLRGTLQIATKSLNRIMSGMTTDINRVEVVTKREVYEALQEIRALSAKGDER